MTLANILHCILSEDVAGGAVVCIKNRKAGTFTVVDSVRVSKDGEEIILEVY